MQPEPGTTETPVSKTGSEDAATAPENEVIRTESSLTETNTSKTQGENTEGEHLAGSKTPKKSGRPAKLTSSTAVTWSVRGVERETRAVIEKAAERAGKTLEGVVKQIG